VRWLLVLAVLALPACSGQDCDELAALRAERDEARAAYARDLPSLDPEESAERDDAVHALDARVFDAEQQCEQR
jgi:hypothetical protein